MREHACCSVCPTTGADERVSPAQDRAQGEIYAACGYGATGAACESSSRATSAPWHVCKAQRHSLTEHAVVACLEAAGIRAIASKLAALCTGRIAVLSPTPAPETVFQSEPAYEGVTGLWALPARPGDGADALLILSSVSGSRALSTGAQQKRNRRLIILFDSLTF